MVQKCANPQCETEFRYASRGRVFSFELRNPHAPCRDVPRAICEKKPSHAAIHFWLCEQCCSKFAVQFEMETGLTLVALPATRHPRGNKMSSNKVNGTAHSAK